MKVEQFVERIKFELTGDNLNLEIADEAIAKAVKYSLLDIQHYINEVRYIELDYAPCIDLKDFDFYAVTKVLRTKPIGSVANYKDVTDPMYLQFWNSFGYGMNYNLNKYLLDYASYSELQQIRNTMSTDMSFTFDKDAKKLYINESMGTPSRVVLEYIPVFKDVDEIKDAYWIDKLRRMALAKTKIILGRNRTRVTQTSSLWAQDGEIMLEEGQKELDELIAFLDKNTETIYPID